MCRCGFGLSNRLALAACTLTIITIVITMAGPGVAHQPLSGLNTMTKFRECFAKSSPIVCLKENALQAIDDTITSDKPINFYNVVEIEKNPNYSPNVSEGVLPEDIAERNLKLNDILHDKIEEFFKSRVVKFNLARAFEQEEEEGRKKGGKGKGGMWMLAMGGMACMVGQMMLGKIAFLAGTALIIAKMALFLSAIIGLKKLASGGGGGGETSHVVYAGGDFGHGGGGGGGGGWHRSLEGNAQELAYRGYDEAKMSGY